MFGFKSKKDEVLNHWIGFVDGFNHSPQEFYAEVERQLAARKIPGMEVSRVEYAEGGVLSDKRIYLRLIRERLAFDACAAPFGNLFFFSCRTVYSPAVIKLWHLLGLLVFIYAVYYPLARLLGILDAAVAVAALVIALAQVFQNTVSMGLSDLDAFLLKVPAVGPVYERWFRIDTYYRQDTRLLYLEAIPKLIKELAEEIVGAKGVKLERQYQNAPVLGDLYKPLPPSVKPGKG